MAYVISVWIVCAISTAIIAANRDRDPLKWLAIGLVLGIFALVIVIALRDKPQRNHETLPLIGAGRKAPTNVMQCPDCGQDTPIASRKCDKCGARLA